jgi:hypothetical protein
MCIQLIKNLLLRGSQFMRAWLELGPGEIKVVCIVDGNQVKMSMRYF